MRRRRVNLLSRRKSTMPYPYRHMPYPYRHRHMQHRQVLSQSKTKFRSRLFNRLFPFKTSKIIVKCRCRDLPMDFSIRPLLNRVYSTRPRPFPSRHRRFFPSQPPTGMKHSTKRRRLSHGVRMRRNHPRHRSISQRHPSRQRHRSVLAIRDRPSFREARRVFSLSVNNRSSLLNRFRRRRRTRMAKRERRRKMANHMSHRKPK